jgi:hypothetical protein
VAGVPGSAIAKTAKLLRAHAFETWPPELDEDLKKTLASKRHEREAIELIRGSHPEIPENLIWARIVYLGLSNRIRSPYRKHIWSQEDDNVLWRDYGRSRNASHRAIEDLGTWMASGFATLIQSEPTTSMRPLIWDPGRNSSEELRSNRRRARLCRCDYHAKQKQVPVPPPAPTANVSDSLRKSSIVFVRTTVETATPRATGPIPVLERKSAGLLPQGLVARLQHSVSSAAKVPVSAVIEYNYEENGQLVVPDGTKAYGDLSQATPQGWVSITFHTLELPSGEQEKINGSALSMDRGALRGDVNGKNTLKKFLTRAFTGVGTVAAFAVGGQGLSGNLDNSVLLRERISSNVGLAGEQELGTLASQQNIVVTVPANTRFYLVLHEAGVTRPANSPGNAEPQITNQNTGAAIQAASTRDAASEQELGQMIQLRNELREMNRLTQLRAPAPLSSDNQ